MNTMFFEKAADIEKNFKWKDIFSDAFQPHTREERARLLTRGIGEHVPEPGHMVESWQKPWLFVRVGAVGLLLSVLLFALWSNFAFDGATVFMFVLPAVVVPLAVMLFFWEMNIPGNISIYQSLFMALLGGILSMAVTGVVQRLFLSEMVAQKAAFVVGPFAEETAKLVIVYILIKRYKVTYGVQGLLVGAAVGVGFSVIESSGYAWNAYQEGLSKAGELAEQMQALNSNTSLDIWSIVSGSLTDNLILRGVTTIGGHEIWAAMYGGALALAKGKGELGVKHLGDKLVIIAWTGAYLLHTVWNFSPRYLIGIVPDDWVIFLAQAEGLYLKIILLIILGWTLLLFIMRKCIRQMVVADTKYKRALPVNTPRVKELEMKAPSGGAALTVRGSSGIHAGKEYMLSYGGNLVFGRNPEKSGVCFPQGAKGISLNHCEIKWKEGFPVLIDRNSTYGTYFGNGQKLEPNVPYKLRDQVKFYLGSRENEFHISIK